MNLSVAPLPKPPADLEHVVTPNKKAGMDTAAAAFIPSRLSPVAQMSIGATAAGHTLQSSAATLVPDTGSYVPHTKVGVAAEPTTDVAESKIKLRPEAAVYFPVAKTDCFVSTFPDKVS